MFSTHGPVDPESPLFVGRDAEIAALERWRTMGIASARFLVRAKPARRVCCWGCGSGVWRSMASLISTSSRSARPEWRTATRSRRRKCSINSRFRPDRSRTPCQLIIVSSSAFFASSHEHNTGFASWSSSMASCSTGRGDHASKECLGGVLIASLLDQDAENRAVLVHGTPRPAGACA